MPSETGTMLNLHQTSFIDDETREHHSRGWSGCFEKLENYLGS